MIRTFVALQVMKTKELCKKLKKDAGGKEILVELGLAVVAIALLVIFKSSISKAITTISTTLQEHIANLFS